MPPPCPLQVYDGRFRYEVSDAKEAASARTKKRPNVAESLGMADELTTSALGKQDAPDDLNRNMPDFVFEHLAKMYGLRVLVAQACWDMLYTLELMRPRYKNVEVFSRFLRELYDEDDTLFFLYVRNIVQDEFGLQLKLREKVQYATGLAEGLVLLKEHPLLRDGTLECYITTDAIILTLKRLFLDTSNSDKTGGGLPEYLLATLLEEHLDEEWQSAEQRAIALFDSVPGSEPPPVSRHFEVMRAMSVNAFLEHMVEEFRETSDEIKAQLKYDDTGDALLVLAKLQDTMRQADQRGPLQAKLHAQELAVAHASVDVEKLVRDDVDGSNRTKIFIARNHLGRKESEMYV